ncbi:filamentous hemagglutinin N-terminal domain-containing protein [Pseudomonas sp. ABC1]|uniref:two-partner secretion domain-containing protein n=1 Tax=Pseudomonas sp. ABC1 TaxID=2748080 RepID=UPI0015C2DE79|nr:filamentous hemagglutinin N-terminal domain-containing protein [Pseudomonas sp. ABC1]QLF93652.1 filamentous hemagglutinin N-terminal domain-containing protein [Pseudomonas sp. ABC1]
MSRKKKGTQSFIKAVSVSVIGASSSVALAAPTGGTVVSGGITIGSMNNNELVITQALQKGIINWTDFSIDAGELVRFAQSAGNDSITLNRVLGSQVSNIQGALQANGNIFLINPNGIVFGAGSQIDVAGLLATTFDVTDSSFLSGGQLEFSQVAGKDLASIANQGTITSGAGGFVYLVAPKVDNSGFVIANVGRVTMAAGDRFTVNLQGSNLINFSVTGDSLAAATGSDLEGVKNSGTVTAQTVLLQGNAASGLMSSVVNNSGIIEATELTIDAGDIVQNGTVKGVATAATTTASLTAGKTITTGSNSSTRATTLNLTVKDEGASIGSEAGAVQVDADVLNATSQSGNVLVTDVSGGVALGEVKAGTPAAGGSVVITAQNGSITSADTSKANVTGYSAKLVADGAVGTDSTAVNTQVGVLSASTQNGGINVDNDGALILGDVIAREQITVGGQTTVSGAVDSSGSITLSNGSTGTRNVKVSASEGVIVTGTVSATNSLTVASDTGSILAAQAGTSLVGRTINLSAGGAVGDASQALSTQSNTLNASASDGGVYVNESNGLTVGTITAAGANNDVVLGATQGNLTVGSITAAGAAVTLTAGNGSIISASGSTTNVTAKDLIATAKSGIATSAKKLGTSVDTLTATTTAAQAGVYATNDKALEALSVTTPNGDTNVAFSGGALTYSRNTNGLALTRLQAMDVSFSNTAAGLKLSGIDAGSDKSVSLTAAGDITQGSGSVVAKDLTLDASGSIGAVGTALQTQASELTLTSRNGIANVANTSTDLALTANATSTNGAVSINQSGNLEVNSVNAKAAVNLTAGGAVTAAASAPGTVISAGSLNVTAASIGSATKALSSKVAGAVNLTATNGDVNFSNIGAITLLDVLASNGKIAFQNSGDTVVGQLQASGTIDFKVSGNVTDGNGSAANFITSGLSAAVKSFGTSGDAIEIQVDELVIDAANGGIYARQASGNLISLKQITSGGTGSDIQIQADGSIKLGNVNAGGNNVKIAAGGSIEDGRTSTASANVVARSLDISAPNGIGQQGDLALDVSFLSAAGGTGGVTATNAGAVAVDASSLTGKGTSAINIVATAITILDNSGGTITMDGGSLVLKATSGNIVFLNQNDTIYLPGGGSITLIATSKSSVEVPGYDGVIIAGNLKTDGGNITLQAQSNITIGMLDAGTTGNVTVASAGGVILDGNGTAQNIRGNVVSLTASTPSEYTAELTRDTAIAEYSARDAEAAAKLLQLNILIQQLKDYEALVTSATLQNSLAELTQRLAEIAANNQSNKVDSMSKVADGLNTALNAATVVRNAAAVIAGAAQAIPFSGDAGADAAFAVVDLVMSAASLALDSYERYSLAPEQDQLVELNNTLDVANAAIYTAATNLATTTAIRDTTATSKAAADLAVFKANTARDAALQVRRQAVAAYNLNQQIDSSADKPLGITANRLNINNGAALDSSLYLDSTGNLGLGDISVASGEKIVASATGNIGVVGDVVSDTFIGLNAGNAILGQGGTLFSPDMLLVAGNGIGANQAVNTQTDRLAADAGNGGVAIVNANGGALLTIGSQGAVKGITGAGDISVTTDGSLQIDQLVKDSTHTHTVSLTSTGGSIIDGNTVERNVQGGTLVASAAGSIDLDTEVDTLDVEVTDAGDITLREANAVTARNLRTASGDIDLNAGGAVVVGSLDAGTGQIDLHVAGAVEDDQDNATLIIADTLNIQATGSVGAVGSNATRALDTQVNTVNVTASGEVNLAEVDDLTIGLLETDHGNVTVTTGGDLNLGALTTGTDVDTVTLIAGQAINSVRDDEASNIDAANLAMSAGSGIGQRKGLAVRVDRLEASGGTGGILVADLDGGLTIGGVTPNLGNPAILGLNTQGGNILVGTLEGDLTVDEAVDNSGSGQIMLVAVEGDVSIAQGAPVTGNGDIAVMAGGNLLQDATVQSVDGSILLQAAGDLTQNALVNTGNGNISVIAGADLLMSADTRIDGTGNVTYSAEGNASLQQITTGTGNLLLSADGDLTQNALLNTGSGNITVSSGADLLMNADTRIDGTGNVTYSAVGDARLQQITTGTGNLLLSADGDLTQNALLNTGSGNITVSSGADLLMNADTRIDGTGNVTYSAVGDASLQRITTGTGNLLLSAGGDLIQNALLNTGNGNITVDAGADLVMLANTRIDGTGDIAYSAGGDASLTNLSTQTGDITVEADGDVQQSGTLSVAEGDVSVSAEGDLSMSDGALVAVGQGNIEYAAGGDLLIDELYTMDGNVALSARDGRIDVHGDADYNVSAKGLVASAGEGIGSLTNALRSDIDNLTASTVNGSIIVDEADDIVLDNVSATNGSIQLTAGDIEIDQLEGEQINLVSSGNVSTLANGLVKGGDLYVNATTGVDLRTEVDTASVSVSGAGSSLKLDETDAITLTSLITDGGDIEVTAAGQIGVGHVDAGTGDVLLQSGEDIVTQRPGLFGRLLSLFSLPVGGITGDRIQLEAASGIGNGTQGALSVTGNTLDASSVAGDIILEQSQAVTLERVTTGNGNVDVTVLDGDAVIGEVSGSGSVSLTADNGQLLDDGDQSTKVRAGGLNLAASTGIGSSGALQTQATSLDAVVSGAGDIFIQEQDGLDRLDASTANGNVQVVSNSGNLAVGQIDAQGHSVRLQTLDGAILDANGNTASNINAQRLDLLAARGVGQSGNALDVNVESLAAVGGNGGIRLNSLSNGELSLSSQSGTALTASQGDIVLTAAGDLGLDGDIENTGGGNIVLTAGNIRQDADIGTSGSGNVSLDSSGSIIMAASSATHAGNGQVSYKAANTLTVAEVQTSSNPGGGKVVFVAPLILDNLPGVANVRAWEVSLSSQNGNSALIKELMGDLNDSSRVDLGARVIGGSLAESRRFMEALLQPTLVQRTPTEQVFATGLLSDAQIRPVRGFVEGENGVMVYSK